MSIDAIAALLGHKTLAMTMIYARIADKTVAKEYFTVTEKVQALYDQPRQLPRDDEGAEMRNLRREMHRRMLGNGHCARPWRPTASSSPSARAAHSSSPPSSSAQPCKRNVTTPSTKAKSPDKRSSTASSTGSTTRRPDPALTRSPA